MSKTENKEQSTLVEKVVEAKLMTLKDLGKLSKEELLRTVNMLGKVSNKSQLDTMQKNGYDFTFAQLEVVAQFAGFTKVSGSSREVTYAADGIKEVLSKKEELDLRDEIFNTARDKKRIKRTPIFIFEEDVEKFKDCVDKNSFFGLKEAAQAVIFKRLLNGEMIVK